MGSDSGIREATEVNPKGDLAVGQLQKWGPQEFNSPAFHQHYLPSFLSHLHPLLCSGSFLYFILYTGYSEPAANLYVQQCIQIKFKIMLDTSQIIDYNIYEIRKER